jgi:hypothetical protein
MLAEICGMDAVSLQPAAGAHGELTGMKMVRAYHRDNGDARRVVLIPASAHGTNPASAALAGYSVQTIEANQAGRVDPEMAIKATRLGASMTTPAETPVPEPSTQESLDRAEERLGFALPPELRQLYRAVADGGFGPGSGLLAMDRVVDRYLAVQGEAPRNQTWPDRLLPLVDDNPVLDCLDASREQGAVITWDPEELSERAGDRAWRRSFSERAPSLEAWLAGWLDVNNPQVDMQAMMRESMAASIRQTRAYFDAMTPDERAAYGLPEVGWEREMGLAVDEDD